MIVKNILLRHEANAEKDPAKQKALIKQADDIRDQGDRHPEGREGRRRRRSQEVSSLGRLSRSREGGGLALRRRAFGFRLRAQASHAAHIPSPCCRSHAYRHG